MVTVSDSMVVQLVPSSECSDSTLLPVRVRRTHFGVAMPVTLVDVVVPPLVSRRWNLFWVAAGLDHGEGVDIVRALPSVPGSRIMTPTFAVLPASPPVMLKTRAVTLPLPVIVWYRKWKASAVPAISAPAPFTVTLLP